MAGHFLSLFWKRFWLQPLIKSIRPLVRMRQVPDWRPPALPNRQEILAGVGVWRG